MPKESQFVKWFSDVLVLCQSKNSHHKHLPLFSPVWFQRKRNLRTASTSKSSAFWNFWYHSYFVFSMQACPSEFSFFFCRLDKKRCCFRCEHGNPSLGRESQDFTLSLISWIFFSVTAWAGVFGSSFHSRRVGSAISRFNLASMWPPMPSHALSSHSLNNLTRWEK